MLVTPLVLLAVGQALTALAAVNCVCPFAQHITYTNQRLIDTFTEAKTHRQAGHQLLGNNGVLYAHGYAGHEQDIQFAVCPDRNHYFEFPIFSTAIFRANDDPGWVRLIWSTAYNPERFCGVIGHPAGNTSTFVQCPCTQVNNANDASELDPPPFLVQNALD